MNCGCLFSKAETERASWIVERVALEREILQKDMEIAQMKKQYRMQVAQLEEAKFYAESQVNFYRLVKFENIL